MWPILRINKKQQNETGKVRCSKCFHIQSAYLTGYDHTGVYEAGVCAENIAFLKVVDPDAIRFCSSFCPKKQVDSEANIPIHH
jgi:hypothetical protein